MNASGISSRLVRVAVAEAQPSLLHLRPSGSGSREFPHPRIPSRSGSAPRKGSDRQPSLHAPPMPPPPRRRCLSYLLPFRRPNFNLTLFHVFYSTSFLILFLILTILILIPPADAIAQATVRTKRFTDVFAIAGVYLLTAIVALVLYVSRLVAYRRDLNKIPKSTLPIGKAELKRKRRVHSLIARKLDWTSYVSWGSRPRAEGYNGEGGIGRGRRLCRDWKVQHSGWSAPTLTSRGDKSGICYASVISEIPSVLEERAISRVSERLGDAAADAVKRLPCLTVRAWLDRLLVLGLELDPEAVETFCEKYERAVFGSQAVGHESFTTLMTAMAAVLKSFGEDELGAVAEGDGRSVSAGSSIAGSQSSVVRPWGSDNQGIGIGINIGTDQITSPNASANFLGYKSVGLSGYSTSAGELYDEDNLEADYDSSFNLRTRSPSGKSHVSVGASSISSGNASVRRRPSQASGFALPIPTIPHGFLPSTRRISVQQSDSLSGRRGSAMSAGVSRRELTDRAVVGAERSRGFTGPTEEPVGPIDVRKDYSNGESPDGSTDGPDDTSQVRRGFRRAHLRLQIPDRSEASGRARPTNGTSQSNSRDFSDGIELQRVVPTEKGVYPTKDGDRG